MSDKNSTKKNDRPGAPKDLPAKPVDKKTDDKVKGGRAPDTFKFSQ